MKEDTIPPDSIKFIRKEDTTLNKDSTPSPISSRELWAGMKEYYDMGLSMIWSRLESEVVKGVDKPPKTPIGTWKSAQTTRFSLQHLSKQMNGTKVQIAPTIICGEVSGNLEVIVINVKHWPGIDAMFFTQVKAILPRVFDILRIHQTGSDEYHVLYRRETPIGIGNKKLASRADNSQAGLETRGEGGFVQCSPGAGIIVLQDRPIPIITWAEWDDLIKITTLFDERIKTVTPKKNKSYDSKYDVTPFKHYNSSSDAEKLLDVEGLTKFENNNSFTHYTIPGKPSGISASWIKDKRIYRNFTSSTSLEPKTNYDPAALLTILQFDGDYKVSFKYLVDRGFGKVKKSYEAKVIKTLAQVKDKAPPANFSQEAKSELEQQRTDRQLNYPHGTYWRYNIKSGTYKVSLTEIIGVANNLGIARCNKNLVRIEEPYFTYIDESEAQTILTSYIKEEREDYIKINDAFMVKWKQYADFLVTRKELKEIDRKELLRSTEFIFYKPFLNGVLEITKDKIHLEENIGKYKKYINRDSVIQKSWRRVTEEQYRECKYVQYLTLSISTEWKYVRRAVGYLCYGHKTRGKGYLIMLLEGTAKGSGGGSGKGMFFEMLGDDYTIIIPGEYMKWTTVKSISGQQIEKGEAEMMQMWNGEGIVHFSDTPKNVNLSKMKDVVTDGGPVKKLFKDVMSVSAEEYPAVGMSSQWGINQEDDPGVKRRVRVLTFTDFFNVNREVRDYFGGSFPDIWTEDDWMGYYNYIADGIQDYLACGKKLDILVEDDLMWKKQFDHTYGMGRFELRKWIHDQVIDKWGVADHIRSSELQSAYESFCNLNNIKREMSIPRLHEALYSWGNRYGYQYSHGVLKRVDGERVRVAFMKKKGEAIGKSTDNRWNQSEGEVEEDLPF